MLGLRLYNILVRQTLLDLPITAMSNELVAIHAAGRDGNACSQETSQVPDIQIEPDLNHHHARCKAQSPLWSI